VSDILSPKEAALFLGVTPKTIYCWLRSKKVYGHKIGGVWRVYRVDLPQPRGKA
jgi:excisionase family DNA binding protein